MRFGRIAVTVVIAVNAALGLAAGGEVVAPLASGRAHENGSAALAFAPDGSFLVTGGESLKVWSMSDGHLRATFKPTKRAIHSLAMADDGKTVVVGSSNETVVFDIESGKAGKAVGHVGYLVLRGETLVVGAPVGRRLTFLMFPGLRAHWRGSVSFQSGRTDFMGQEGVASVAMTRDGSTLVFGTLSGAVGVWSFDDQNLSTITGNLPVFPMNALAISPDGSLLAYAQQSERTITLRWTAKGAWVPMKRFADENPSVDALAFTPDGRALVSAGENVKLWGLEVTGEPPRIERVEARELAVFKAPNAVAGIAISPDGKILATADGDGLVALWDLDPPAFRTYLSDPSVKPRR